MFKSLIYLFLFLLGLLLGVIITYYLLKDRAQGWLEKWKAREESRIRKDAADRSRAVLKGKVGEQLAPLLPVFDYEPADARFIGSPVDYIIFEGVSKGEPKGVTFADVKTGKSARLSKKERALKKAIENGEVKWETIRVESPE